ncbi:hypothetical protein VTN77DRAFT_1904 [Rasamsonia byssochlamydoides]|uniref:uncharacterized protein n=1 Tax=Rasamsonia byssochlamydoides TaxID=89139 RepID=UPI0037425795
MLPLSLLPSNTAIHQRGCFETVTETIYLRLASLLSCLGPLVVRLPVESLAPLIERLSNLTTSQSINTSVPNTALRVMVTSLPYHQPGIPPTPEVSPPRCEPTPARWNGI